MRNKMRKNRDGVIDRCFTADYHQRTVKQKIKTRVDRG